MFRLFSRRKDGKGTGFTLVELMVSISIFIFLTALLIARYGNFDQSVLFTNLSYDIALAIRTAQTYGVAVLGEDATPQPIFRYPYGISFCVLDTCEPDGSNNISFNNRRIYIFADKSASAGNPLDRGGAFDAGDIVVSSYTIKRGAKVRAICRGSNKSTTKCDHFDTSIKRVDITFKRPEPDAIICVSQDPNGAPKPCVGEASPGGPEGYVRIFVENPGGSIRGVAVRSTGQISVEDFTPSEIPAP